jgi:GNAT superfamily N-acetyltransferase
MAGIDQLVRLYDLPPLSGVVEPLRGRGILLRRPRAYEKVPVLAWVARHFASGWLGECDVTFSRQPVSTYIATHQGQLVGFICYDTTYRGFLGPLGVAETHRRQGIGVGLLLQGLHAMAEAGYAYAILGHASEHVAFYRKWVGAIDIPGSETGIYTDKLQELA